METLSAVINEMDTSTVLAIKANSTCENHTVECGNNDAGMGSSDTTPLFGKVVRDICLPIIVSCGIVGIILTVIVLSRKNMSTSTNCYLTGLALADLFFLVFFAIRLCEKLFRGGNSYYLFQIYAIYATILMNIFLLMSIWITVMLAVERYVAICRPFIATKVCTVMKARIIIVLIFFACLIIRLPNFFEYTVESYKIGNNSRLFYPVATKMSQDYRYYGVYPWIVEVVIMSIIPFMLLVVLNVCLIVAVKKSSAYIQQSLGSIQGRSHSFSVHKEELQITIMLISVIIVFFICQVPYVIYMCIASLNGFQNKPSFQTYRYLAILLLTLKSSVNFILYCWFSEKFLNTLKKIFCIEQCSLKFLNMSQSNSNGTSYFNLKKRFSSSGNTRVTFVTDYEDNKA